MSKKSRKRNKKILATIAALGGAALLANRRGTAQGVSGSDKAKFTSDPAYQIPGGDESSFKVQDVTVTPPKINNNTFRTRGKIIDSAGNTIDSAGMTLNRRANAVTGVDGSPTIINPYRNRVHVKRGQTAYSKGGRVKGAGCAKRGFGRAFKGGKK